MNDLVNLTFACLAGKLLGFIFFGGLCWIVRKCMTTPNPALWLLGSALIRMSVTLTGFYFVSNGQWQRILACLVGFMIARLMVTWLTQSLGDNQTSNESRQDFRHPENAETLDGFRYEENESPHFIGRELSKEANHAS